MAFSLGAASAPKLASGGFGAAPAASAGAASTGGFGGFGAAPAASSVGAASTGGFGGFGAAPAASSAGASTGGFGGFGAPASSAGAASTGGFGGFGAAPAASSAGAASTGGFAGFGTSASSSGASKPAFGGFGASAATGGGFGGFGAATSKPTFGAASGGGFGFGAATSSTGAAGTSGFSGFGTGAASMGSSANGVNAGHTSSNEAYARFRREAQRWDFASANLARADGLESALAKALEAALVQTQRPANTAGNHITPQRMLMLGFGMAQTASARMGTGVVPGMGFGQPMSGAGFGGAAGMGNLANRSRYHGLDDHNEDSKVFDWPIRPNAVTEYRHIFYQPISRKECQERNALVGHPAVHDEKHTPNDLCPADVDDHMWQQALLNKPQNPEYEYQLQQVVGYRGLNARMQARQKRVHEMQSALTGVERRISRMSDNHARHTQEAQEHRHRQQEISHQMLRVMGKVERLHSERLRLPWTAAEDDLAARLRLLTKQLQHPAHPVNALNHLGPRVRLADASLPAERDTGVAASAFTLNDEDKRAIAAVLQEQRKGLEFLRNTLHTDVRHVQLMLEHVSNGGSATVAFARGSTAQSMLSQGSSITGFGPPRAESAAATDGGFINPLHGGGTGISGLGLPAGSGATSVGAAGSSPPIWGLGGAPVFGAMQPLLPGMGPTTMHGTYGAYGVTPGMGVGGMPMGMPMGMQAASPFANAQMGAARMGF